MKIDRLLSMIMYLLNRDQVSATELAKRYSVSVRTIQRDIETIELAGVPITSTQGPYGGYGIMENWKMDKQLMSVDDLYFIMTALKSVDSTLFDTGVQNTIEKMNALMPSNAWNIFAERNEKLNIDFSQLGGDLRHKEIFAEVKRAVENQQLLGFQYTSNKLEQTSRTIEPMTIAFRWNSWYLFGFCLERNDYRLFKISRIKSPEMLTKTFKRRSMQLEDFLNSKDQKRRLQEYILKFDPPMSSVVKDAFPNGSYEEQTDGTVIATLEFPPDNWVYGYILSFGPYVEVLSPKWAKEKIREGSLLIAEKNK